MDDEIDAGTAALTVEMMTACRLLGDAAVPQSERPVMFKRAMRLVDAAKLLADATPEEAGVLERLTAHLRGEPSRAH